MQCTISVEFYTEEAWKPSWLIIALTGASVACGTYHLSNFF